MTRPTRILAWVGGLFVLLLVILLTAPFLFRGRIEERAKLEANKNLEAKVDWRDLGLGFFGNFPNLTVTLNDLRGRERGSSTVTPSPRSVTSASSSTSAA